MAILTEKEQLTAAAEVRELIVASGQIATLLRRQAGESLYGSDEGQFSEVCTFPIELTATPAKDLVKQIDATASVLPELDARVEDRVRYIGCDYRVQTVVPQSLFGILTHKTLELVLLHGS